MPTAHPAAPLPPTTPPVPPLPPGPAQAERLIALGVPGITGLDPVELRTAAAAVPPGALLVLHPGRAPVSALAPLIEVDGRRGFVVEDMTDVDAFGPSGGVKLPPGPVYAVAEPDRGDALRNRSPDEALPALRAAGRTPLTLGEGVQWLLQCPAVLERGSCFMTVGSRLVKAGGRLDPRTPALWISNGTGRDGRERRGAPKVGWCWAGNRHTWLGFASTAGRASL